MRRVIIIKRVGGNALAHKKCTYYFLVHLRLLGKCHVIKEFVVCWVLLYLVTLYGPLTDTVKEIDDNDSKGLGVASDSRPLHAP